MAWSVEMTQKQSTDQDYILKAMVSMAAADGDFHDNELATIRTVYEQNTGEAISAEDINKVSLGRRSQATTFAEQLAAEQNQLSRELKETILSSAYMVLLADGRVSARERKKLMELAVALKISDVHRSIIFEDVERALS
jgi:DnaJ-domain-containing protein 1